MLQTTKALSAESRMTRTDFWKPAMERSIKHWVTGDKPSTHFQRFHEALLVKYMYHHQYHLGVCWTNDNRVAAAK